MAKRMSDDDVMNYVYTKMFGDLDRIESKSLFDDEDTGLESGTVDNAKPESENSGGVTITVTPLVKSAEEGPKESDQQTDGLDNDDDEDELRDISKLSPLMAQLHGAR